MKHYLAFSLIFTFYFSWSQVKMEGTCHFMPLGFSEKAILNCRGFYSDSLSPVVLSYDNTGEKMLTWQDYGLNAQWTILFKGEKSEIVVIYPMTSKSVAIYTLLFSTLYTSIKQDTWGFEQFDGTKAYIQYKATDPPSFYVFYL